MPRFIDVAPAKSEDEVVSVVGPVCVQRQQTVTIDRDLALILALEDYCVACGFAARPAAAGNNKQRSVRGNTNGDAKTPPEYSAFLQKLEGFSKDELSATLLVDLAAVASMSSKCVGCIGCRTAVDKLLKAPASANAVLEPLVLTEEKFIAVNRLHMCVSDAIA